MQMFKEFILRMDQFWLKNWERSTHQRTSRHLPQKAGTQCQGRR
uniref:Testis cDNA clone: QtsA-18725, similar to human HIV-1 induced protein HIN-1 (HSHIN1), transcript variant1 n=1 Tax=Macaca fascicularis TaxID=9541 RepID=Q4R385_MACFA|nr:unnamed protein product [Macaca fascicularis]